MKTAKRIMLMLSITALLCCLLSVAAFAAGSGDVAGAVESTWTAASGQIKSVVNKVVFPAIDMILAIFFFVKLGTAYFDYRKTGQFEWMNCTPFVRQYDILSNKWGVFLCQKEYRTNDTRRNSRSWSWKPCSRSN